MTTLSTVTTRATFAAALTVAAVIAVMVEAKTAKAWDRHATDGQMTAELSHRAIGSHHYSSGPYASAEPRGRGFGGGTSVPYAADAPAGSDFQLQGR